jgi:hypothetical protein
MRKSGVLDESVADADRLASLVVAGDMNFSPQIDYSAVICLKAAYPVQRICILYP